MTSRLAAQELSETLGDLMKIAPSAFAAPAAVVSVGRALVGAIRRHRAPAADVGRGNLQVTRLSTKPAEYPSDGELRGRFIAEVTIAYWFLVGASALSLIFLSSFESILADVFTLVPGLVGLSIGLAYASGSHEWAVAGQIP